MFEISMAPLLNKLTEMNSNLLMIFKELVLLRKTVDRIEKQNEERAKAKKPAKGKKLLNE